MVNSSYYVIKGIHYLRRLIERKERNNKNRRPSHSFIFKGRAGKNKDTNTKHTENTKRTL